LAFEDPFHDYVHQGFKGYIEEGGNAGRAISSLKDHSSKIEAWGRYDFIETEGRGKSVLTLNNLPNATGNTSIRRWFIIDSIIK